MCVLPFPLLSLCAYASYATNHAKADGRGTRTDLKEAGERRGVGEEGTHVGEEVQVPVCRGDQSACVCVCMGQLWLVAVICRIGVAFPFGDDDRTSHSIGIYPITPQPPTYEMSRRICMAR